ncbi:peptidase U32 family protein [Alistipes provencensis]|uniref:peptidase U32 family protein n=1 Tax=Alistipes provencensis TaxID=1816676 RepID=UPI0007EE1633|nr:U32 family peptidase [Alistipes provencensis]
MKTVELLAPAKDYASAVAAVDYGADAVYIGGAKFGARQAAGNAAEEIARVAEYAHRFGVRVHATLNTLLWDDELEEAERQARELIAAGVDALIVQDMALRRMSLPVELHASTQVCNSTPEGARFLGETGFARVILERNLSLDEIRAICSATTAEVECFVHGAICVGYSGRCFLSRSMSGRSGNRGACSQPCRLAWDLTDGKGRTYIPGKHLLSVRDMNLSQRIGDLLDAGVTSFKIEGRLKDTNYIRNVVAYYRWAVDEALAVRQGFVRSSVGESVPDFTPDPSKSFTRGESEYFFAGKRPGVASFDTPKAVGEQVGRVAKVVGSGFVLSGEAELAPGDGICFISPRGVTGTNINAVEGRRITPNRMDGIVAGAAVYRNSDRLFNLRLERSRTRRVIPAAAVVEASAEGFTITYTDCEGVAASAGRTVPLDTAKNPGANASALRVQAMKSGDTIFTVRDAEVRGAEWFVPASLAAEVRREAFAALDEARRNRPLEHRILPDDPAARYPSEELTAEENVTNRLAEAFYRDHGVVRIERGLDLAPTTAGHRVMRSAYCIRREIGECLRERPQLRGDLYLEHGAHRYRLEFDCAACEMSLIDCTKNRK